MHPFHRRVAVRIASVSLLLAAVAGPLAWMVAREQAEEGIVSSAMEESRRVLHQQNALPADRPDTPVQAQQAAAALVGGLFEIAEIYQADGTRLAESMTPLGQSIEKDIPHHSRPDYQNSFYENQPLSQDRWALRVFIPLREGQRITGYFEGVRLIPPWQREQIFSSGLSAALMVVLASLVCGGVLYPIVIRLVADNERKAKEVLESHVSMMEALGRAIAKRDSDTGAHNYRVAWISATLGEAVGLAGSKMQELIAGSFLHDAGKIGIPDAILLKPGKLTPEEMDIMRTHVAMGEEIVTGAGWLDGGKEVVACHHEKWDGSGYPRQLSGESIPLVARIFAIADVFDALCSKRPYKDPFPVERAMEILRQGSGRHFDPNLMQEFTRLSKHIHATTMNATEDETRALMEAMVHKHFST
jgi:HD-GYP domain-containing protein (c-di-GMP phosphodiesterase class II)